MQCPNCQYNDTRVVDSRPADEGRSIRRRRECPKCGTRFTTFERTETTPLFVIKNDGSREEFKGEKLLRGLVRAAEKRPIKSDRLMQVVAQVEKDLRKLGESEVTSQIIGEYALKYLKDIDEIAYIRFSSVYKHFDSVEVFLNELQEIVGNDKTKKD
ncbi:transcriptional repressor NrdR [Periweissella cryptocerci]|uniref:Transcriptional repressor NrdR n=1 Tax=Periweissella cryptocerci TaxID=2506420 RepID=A0A4P6YSA6_9LACO|nr:transcriptional regulator NrdR [Periweissella cryptocerci]QBO35574.1 transcriptional repressor NrdR [Periweissella cryptocerci]